MAITRILLDSALEIIQRAEEFIVDPTKDETKKQTVSDAIAKLKEQLHEDVDLPLIFFEPVDPTSKVTVDPVPEELQLETKYLYNPIISKAAQKLCDTITCTVHGANIVYRNTRLWGIRMKTGGENIFFDRQCAGFFLSGYFDWNIYDIKNKKSITMENTIKHLVGLVKKAEKAKKKSKDTSLKNTLSYLIARASGAIGDMGEGDLFPAPSDTKLSLNAQEIYDKLQIALPK